VVLYAFDGNTESVVAYIDERCNATYEDRISYNGNGMIFIEETGSLLLFQMGSSCVEPFSCNAYEYVLWVAEIRGFPTTSDILQTYEPPSGPISFRVPYMPEGFQQADYFDTYYGDLATVGDWSKAQPLECGYPATAPSVGDYLTVEDTLPPLEPGQGRYYVTAVTHQGQMRYGRKSSGGVLTGRDPAVLPGCAE
jgi:hypothetical protein